MVRLNLLESVRISCQDRWAVVTRSCVVDDILVVAASVGEVGANFSNESALAARVRFVPASRNEDVHIAARSGSSALSLVQDCRREKRSEAQFGEHAGRLVCVNECV